MEKERKANGERRRAKAKTHDPSVKSEDTSFTSYPKVREQLSCGSPQAEGLYVFEGSKGEGPSRFEDLIVWQKARVLTRDIYRMTNRRIVHKDAELSNQMRKSAVSITSNIAEGQGRTGMNLYIQFLSHASGSCAELRSQLYVALDVEFISVDEFNPLYKQVLEVGRMLHGLSESLKRSRRTK